MTHETFTAESVGIKPPAQLTNMRLAMTAMLKIAEAPPGVPRLGLFFGQSGYGKSVAAAHISAHFDGIYVVAEPTWTQRAMLEAIASELCIAKLERSAPRLLAQIKDQLTASPQPLVIDETDYIVDRDWIEIIRAIHDATRIPILMIGEETLPSKLKKRERFDNRILVSQPAEPASVEDALLLRDHYCNRAVVENDLVVDIHAACHGVTRRIVVNLQQAQAEAMAAGTASMNRERWANRPFMTGQLPRRRKVAA